MNNNQLIYTLVCTGVFTIASQIFLGAGMWVPGLIVGGCAIITALITVKGCLK